MSLALRALELVFSADKRRALLRLRAEVTMRQMQRAAVDAENARLDLEEYERGARAAEQARRDCL